MASNSAWSALNLGPENDLPQDSFTARLAMLGKHALETGKISPQQAQAQAVAMGVLPASSSSPLAMGGLPGQPPTSAVGYSSPSAEQSGLAIGTNPTPSSPVDMNAGMPKPAMDVSSLMASLPKLQGKSLGKVSADEKTSTTSGTKQSNTVLNSKSDDQYQNEMDRAMDPEGPIGQEQASIERMKQLMGLQNAADANKSLVNLSPIGALADYENARHGVATQMAAGMKPGTIDPNQLMAQQAAITKAQSEIPDQVAKNIATQKGGSTTDAQTANQTAMLNLLAAQQNPQNQAMLQLRRQTQAIGAGASFDKDPLLKQITGTNNSLNRAVSIMDGKTPINAKNFSLLQQDMINAMAPGGAATEGKVNREMVDTLAGTLNDIQTRFGDINDLRKEQPQVFAQLRGLIHQVKDDYNIAGKQRVGEIASNYQDVPDDMVQSTVNRKVDMLNTRFSQAVPGPGKYANGAPAAKPAGPAIGTQKGGYQYKGGDPANPASWTKL